MVGFYLLSKLISYIISFNFNNDLVSNLLALGISHTVLILVLTIYTISKRKHKTVQELRHLFICFYIMSVFQAPVYLAYAYSILSGEQWIATLFMDIRNSFLIYIIVLFFITAGTYLKLSDIENAIKFKNESEKQKRENATIIRAISEAYIKKDFTILKPLINGNDT